MNNYTFEIKSSLDFLNKLINEAKDFSKDRLSSGKAINCAMTSWHLHEWVLKEYEPQLPFRGKEEFRKYLIKRCPSLGIMHDIATGAKHMNASSQKSELTSTKYHKGDFNDDFSRDFDISDLKMELKSGKDIIFELELNRTIDFWKDYFEKDLKVNVA